jgi:hypothetical protein
MNAKGELQLDEPFRHEGVLGTVYTGTLIAETEVGGPEPQSPVQSSCSPQSSCARRRGNRVCDGATVSARTLTPVRQPHIAQVYQLDARALDLLVLLGR